MFNVLILYSGYVFVKAQIITINKILKIVGCMNIEKDRYRSVTISIVE